jgi:hypothetical protein
MGFWIRTSNFMFLLLIDSLRERLRNQVVSTFVWYVMNYWLAEVWIQIRDILIVLSLSLFRLENHVYLSRDVQVADVAWRAAMRIVAGVGDLVQRRRGDEEHGFLGWASKPRLMVCQLFGLKTTRTVSPSLTSKSVTPVSPSLASKSMASGFPVCASKPTATVWWFMAQNHRDDFLVWASKPSELRFVCYTTKPMQDEDGA